MKTTKDRRLDNFGMSNIISASERLQQYRADCKALPRAKRGRFWIEIFERDVEVAELAGVVERNSPRGRGRRR